MITYIDKISDENIDYKILEKAKEFINKDGLIAFPTETVYGLGASALSSVAIKKIYKVKGRPSDNPLIVHISEKEDVYEIAKNINKDAELLIDKFWPGPLTIIFFKKEIIPYESSGGLETIGIRLPNTKIARELIKIIKKPLVAPSANLSGKPSPTKASHVISDLNNKINMIIDGGECSYGLESTIIDMTAYPCILRPGPITKDMIEKVLNKEVLLDKSILSSINIEGTPRSPGMKYKHYSPLAKLYIVEGENNKVVEKINSLSREHINKNYKVGIMSTDFNKHLYKNYNLLISLGNRDNPENIGANLFNTLREFDLNNIDIIFSESFKEEGINLAIMNRLKKASGYNIIKV